ncbi:MAG: Putative NTP pyrophosphohydrolase protein,MutT/nudix family [Candidatus Tokpelaia hoelldobleri]|uniref:NTP pyrophosphohydrolase protein,MutT/nudix family n=1 Tax=Candidatus Tokpelaia hoelldobleri TaxID=1902579 RepID=A0A1U9JTK9_9HYPH|nr:MAG: Putative NTP pyrophosphohydrolase protein,MutT/nudix family [Candidatus Tokpelaia hoelldoblerii]
MTQAVSRFSTAFVAARLESVIAPALQPAGDFFSGDGKPQHLRGSAGWKPAAVLIALVDRPQGAGVLLTQRADRLNSHSGQVSFPGGGVEKRDRTVVEAALREAHEEITLQPEMVRLAGVLPPYYAGTGYKIAPVVGIIPAGCPMQENPDEVQEIFEVPLAFLMDLNNYHAESRCLDNREHHFHAIDWQSHKIWGMTAGILRLLYERVYG